MAAKTKTKAVATAAPVFVVLDGETYELTPNINAVRALNATFGGLKPALDAVQALNYDALVQIVVAGAAVRMKPSEIQRLGESLWRDPNRAEALTAVAEFLVLLLNGGKPAEDGGDADAAAEADSGNS